MRDNNKLSTQKKMQKKPSNFDAADLGTFLS